MCNIQIYIPARLNESLVVFQPRPGYLYFFSPHSSPTHSHQSSVCGTPWELAFVYNSEGSHGQKHRRLFADRNLGEDQVDGSGSLISRGHHDHNQISEDNLKEMHMATTPVCTLAFTGIFIPETFCSMRP